MADQLGAGPEHDVPGTIRRLPSGAVYVKRRVRNPRHAIYGAWVAVGSVGECGVVALHDEELNGSVITGTVLGGPTACPSTGAAAEHLDPTDCPIGTVLVDPDTGRWAVRFDCGDDTGKGQHVWLAPAGVLASGARFLHHAEVRGWQVGEARRWRLADDTPAVDGDVRRRAISALTELVSEFISPDEFGGYDIHYGELVDVVLAEVQPELDHLGTYKETAPVLAAMVDDLRAELRHRNRAYGRASETIGHLRAEQAHYREKLRIAHEAIERATRHRAAAQGIVMYVVDTLGLPVNTVGDAAAIGQALRELKSELARQRESRLAWAIEADRLDVIATEACLVTHPRECGRDESDCTNDDSCPRAEERYATADDLIGAMALSEEVAQLTREQDDAREELTSFYSTTRGLAGMFWADPEDHQALDALSDIRRQLAAWRADATQVPEGWQSLVRKGWSVGSRPAIPADAADLAWSACMDDDKFNRLTSDQILEVIRRTLKAIAPVPVSGSDTTTDGGDQ